MMLQSFCYCQLITEHGGGCQFTTGLATYLNYSLAIWVRRSCNSLNSVKKVRKKPDQTSTPLTIACSLRHIVFISVQKQAAETKTNAQLLGNR